MKKNSMKMMTLCLLLTLCLSGIFLFSTSVYAEDAKITIEDVKAAPGETIEIKVKIVENPGIAFLRVPLVYDKTYFESMEMEGVGLEGWTIKTAAVWAEADNSDYTGDILIVRCKVYDDALEGTAVVKLGEIEAWTDKDETVPFEVEGGTVTIQKKEEIEPTTNVEVVNNPDGKSQISSKMVVGIIVVFAIIVGIVIVIMRKKRNSDNKQ